MAQINFPAASESPWYNPDNGVTYEYIDGTWRTVTTASQLDDIYVKEIGDTMTGELILHGNPAQNLGATPKQYVDTEITNAISGSEGGETGRLDGRYLRKDAGAGNQTVASTGTTTFDGLVEAGDGVKVTGGDAADVVDGVYNSNGINIALNGQVKAVFQEDICQFRRLDGNLDHFTSGSQYSSIRAKNTTVNNPTLLLSTEVDKADISGHSIVIANNPIYTNVSNNATLYGFTISNPQNNSSATGVTFYSYGAINMADKFDTNIGYLSQLGKGSKTNFNFYTLGDAPNFFKGDTYIGGTATRNTRELWESTLTEEQKEQLAAGTLAIPANVSAPGDGSFVRQWWYDQQSAEDQALIDAGELDYPERYQPENFVDTFALGTDTNINLLDNGNGEFKGGIRISGGTSSDTIYGTNNLNFSSPTSTSFRVNGDIIAVFNSSKRFVINADQHAAGNTSIGLQIGGQLPNGVGANNGFGVQVTSGNEVDATNDSLTCYNARGDSDGTVNELVGYRASGNLTDVATSSYGFYSSLASGSGNNYNFYAEGTAPSYFRGTTEHEGGLKITGGSTTTSNISYDSGESRLKITSANTSTGIAIDDATGNVLIGTASAFTSDRTRLNIDAFSGGTTRGAHVYGAGEANDAAIDIVGFQTQMGISSSHTIADNVVSFEAVYDSKQWQNDAAKIAGDVIAFNSSPNHFAPCIGRQIAFRANNAASGNAFNFYAEGAAPNYFNGEIRCGGDPADPLNNQGSGFAGIVNNNIGRKSLYVCDGEVALGRSQDPSVAPGSPVSRNGTGIQLNAYKAEFSLNNNSVSDSIMSINRGNGDTGDATPMPAINFHANGTKYASIDISSSGAAFNNTSDYRAKTNIRDYTGASSVIQSLNVKQYTLFDEPDVVGFIAHELQEVLPKAVRGDKDATEAIGTLADYDGTVLETAVTEPSAEELIYTEDVTDEEGVSTQAVRTRTWTATGTQPVYQGVDQTKLIPLLTKALQEALGRIEALEADHATLMNNNNNGGY